MKCPKCNKEVSELEEKCTFCGLNFEEYESQKENENPEYADKTIFLRFIIGVQVIGCIIGAIILWNNEETGLGFIVLFGGLIAAACTKGFTDIIDLLDNINNKLN